MKNSKEVRITEDDCLDNRLKETINDFVAERLNESYRKTIRSKSYEDISNTCKELFNEIKKRLNDFELAEEYQEAESLFYALQLDEAYKTGFQDSAKIFLKDIL